MKNYILGFLSLWVLISSLGFINHSDPSYTDNFYARVVKGDVPGHSMVFINGANEALANGVKETDR